MIVIKMRTNQYLCLKYDLHPLCQYIIVLGKIISHYNRMMRMCCSRDYIVIEQPKPRREIT